MSRRLRGALGAFKPACGSHRRRAEHHPKTICRRGLVWVLLVVLFLQIGTVSAQTSPQAAVTSTGPFTVTEGTLKVADMTASGFDADDNLSWSITTDAGSGADGAKFVLRFDNALAFAAPKNYENLDDDGGDGTYEVTVKVSDGAETDPVEATATISVTVTDAELEEFSSDSFAIDFEENSLFRVATLAVGDPLVSWSLTGSDSSLFSVEDGIVRFLEPPDFESPSDAGGDNIYNVTVVAVEDSSSMDTTSLTITVLNAEEQGSVALPASAPELDEEVTVSLSDPDGIVGDPVWMWQRSAGRNAWQVIDGATRNSYTPVAADTGEFLRVTATYSDTHGSGKKISEVLTNLVRGPLLTGLAVTTANSLANADRAMYPQFHPETLHYGIGCDSNDTMNLNLSAADDVRVAVDGVQTGSPSATVSRAATEDSDVLISVTDAAGARTTYSVHCLLNVFFDITTTRYPNVTDMTDDLILFSYEGMSSRRTYIVAMDYNGVPRLRRRVLGLNPFAIRFYRVGDNGAYRYAYSVRINDNDNRYVILDEDLEVIDYDVRAVRPLTRTGQHDFRILDDESYLLMSYEPATRDFSDLPFTAESSVAAQDSAAQIVTPLGAAAFTWNSWDHMALEDCVQHLFPMRVPAAPEGIRTHPDYAHLNGVDVADGVFVGSFRGCSKVLGVDVASGDVVWRMGLSNLSDDEWAERGIGPAPLQFVDDPEGGFCGQHASQVLPNGNILLFDNGVHCLVDPRTYGPVGRAREDFSRAVEYALDLENHEAVFVRDRSLDNDKSWVGLATGNVDPLDNGDWLVSWGRPGRAPLPEGAPLIPQIAFTLVNPDSGVQKLRVAFKALDPTRALQINASHLPAEVFVSQPRPLTATLVSDSDSHWKTFSRLSDRPQVVVSFDQPVVDFDESTTSIGVVGADIVGVKPFEEADESANSYLVTLMPEGGADIVVSLVAGQACDSEGICTADGSEVEIVSRSNTVRFEAPRAALIPGLGSGPTSVPAPGSGQTPRPEPQEEEETGPEPQGEEPEPEPEPQGEEPEPEPEPDPEPEPEPERPTRTAACELETGTAMSRFSDISSRSPVANDVGCLVDLEVTTGTSPTTFSPGRAVTREQMAAFLARLYGAITKDPAPLSDTPFSDVPRTSFAYHDIGRIYGLGITKGTSPTTFSPDRVVTREEMAAFLARFYEIVDGEAAPLSETPFSDVPRTSFAYHDIGRIYGLGITKGTSPTTFSPTQTVTREQMASFIARLYRQLTVGSVRVSIPPLS